MRKFRKFVCLKCKSYYDYETAVDCDFECRQCKVILMPLKPFKRKEEIEINKVQTIESSSSIGYGEWSIFQIAVGNRSGSVFVCNCPSFLKRGDCKHIRKFIAERSE